MHSFRVTCLNFAGGVYGAEGDRVPSHRPAATVEGAGHQTATTTCLHACTAVPRIYTMQDNCIDVTHAITVAGAAAGAAHTAAAQGPRSGGAHQANHRGADCQVLLSAMLLLSDVLLEGACAHSIAHHSRQRPRCIAGALC